MDRAASADAGGDVVRIDRSSAADAAWQDRVRLTYDEAAKPLWRAVTSWAGSVDVADEAVAEAFAQLLRRGDDVRDPKAWVWKAAFRLAAGDLKRRRSGPESTDGYGDDGRRGPLSVVPDPVRSLPDEAIDLVRALAQLSEQQRRCIALVDVAGHTAPSAAEILGTTAATVRVQLMRARRRLRTLLADPPEPEPAR